jgi:hypothetical protein
METSIQEKETTLKLNLRKMKKIMALRSRKPKLFSTIHLQLRSMILITQMVNPVLLILDFP